MQISIFRNFFRNDNFSHFSVTLHFGMILNFGCTNSHFYSSKLRQECKKKKNTRICRTKQYLYTKSCKNRPGAHIWVNRRISPEGRYWRKAEGECFAPFLNFYSKLIFFLLFSCIFPLILMQTFIFRNFSKMSIFRIFLLRSTLEWFWTFGARFFVFILSKLRQGYKKEKNTRIWRTDQYSYSKSWKNRPGAYIRVNRRISPEGRYWRKAEGECFAPFLNFYWKSMLFLLFSYIFF